MSRLVREHLTTRRPELAFPRAFPPDLLLSHATDPPHPTHCCAPPTDRSSATVGQETAALEQRGSPFLDSAVACFGGVALGLADCEARHRDCLSWEGQLFGSRSLVVSTTGMSCRVA